MKRQIVIEISEGLKDAFNHEEQWTALLCAEMRDVLNNSTPLPKDHGRIVDAEPIYDKLIRTYRADERDYPERGKDYRIGLSNAMDFLSNAPTIIEAEKEG